MLCYVLLCLVSYFFIPILRIIMLIIDFCYCYAEWHCALRRYSECRVFYCYTRSYNAKHRVLFLLCWVALCRYSEYRFIIVILCVIILSVVFCYCYTAKYCFLLILCWVALCIVSLFKMWWRHSKMIPANFWPLMVIFKSCYNRPRPDVEKICFLIFNFEK